MSEPTPDGPLVRIPERIDRPARFGPFPSARDAARFLCYAASGALLAPWIGPWLWIPAVGAGFVIAVWQPDGRPVDERALAYLLWRFHPWTPRFGVSARSFPGNRVIRLASGAYIAILRAGGCPVAYMPPAELERRFTQFRDALRSISGQFAILCTTAPLRAAPVRPQPVGPTAPDAVARDGYVELTDLLCRRRSVRRVYLALRTVEVGTGSLTRLDAESKLLLDRLNGLGLRATRLQGVPLAEAATRFGWTLC